MGRPLLGTAAIIMFAQHLSGNTLLLTDGWTGQSYSEIFYKWDVRPGRLFAAAVFFPLAYLRAGRVGFDALWYAFCSTNDGIDVRRTNGGTIMARIIGYVCGGLLLLDALSYGLQPRRTLQFWNESLGRHLPEPVSRLMMDYSHLSDPTLRATALWEATVAGVMLWLAGRVRD